VKTSELAPVIGVEDSKCKNCHACIEACPVKYCIDGSGETVRILHDRCIGCGRCIDACHHQARYLLDDADEFFRALARKEKVVALIAPAAAAGFAGKTGQLVGWLRAMGVSAVFDASFGAELAAASYIRFLEEKKPGTVIAQPCPAIVSYIELYRPELISRLAPVDSPLLHSARMLRARYPEYAHAKIAAITPCLAKKREFDDTGIVSWNVTFVSVNAKLAERKKSLMDFPVSDFDGPDA
jgi:iron only hydrogenase large subunit-like protein